jgi:hypothetical protein
VNTAAVQSRHRALRSAGVVVLDEAVVVALGLKLTNESAVGKKKKPVELATGQIFLEDKKHLRSCQE